MLKDKIGKKKFNWKQYIKNDLSQPRSIYQTRDPDHETEITS
jgi:hypothetical protein